MDAWAHWDEATASYWDALVDVWAGRVLPAGRLRGRPRRFGSTQGTGATLYLNSSEKLQRWSVRPLAIAGVCLGSLWATPAARLLSA